MKLFKTVILYAYTYYSDKKPYHVNFWYAVKASDGDFHSYFHRISYKS